MDTKQTHKLRKFIKELASIRGRHTELISVYVPAGYDINKIIQHMEEEQGTASNIKDKTTRTHVIDSLERAIRHLRLFKKTPENGIAVFSGNASERDNVVDIKVWSLETPDPLKFRLYRCDQTFVLDPLKEMLEHKETYGLIVLDRREATIGLLKGTSISQLINITSGVPGKTQAGGQCIIADTIVETKQGHKKIRDINIGDEIKGLDTKSNKIIFTECINKWKRDKNKYRKFIFNNNSSILSSFDHAFFIEKDNNLIEISAENLSSKDFLIFYYNNKLIPMAIKEIININKKVEMIDIETKSKNFFANNILVHNSAHRYERIREGMTKEFFVRIGELANKYFLNIKTTLKGILIGGPGPTKEEFFAGDYLNNEIKQKVLALQDQTYTDETGLHDLVEKSKEILSKEIIIKEKQLMQKFFEMLAKTPEKVSYGLNETKKALDFAAVDTLLLSDDLEESIIEEFIAKAESTNAKVELISTETREGQQLRDLGGIGAILRYALS